MSLARKIGALFVSTGLIDLSFGGTPAGVLLPFAGTTAPDGWLMCFGQAVSRTTYASLFSAIGTSFGSGDGSTTFNLPDMRGRLPAGKDDMGGSAAGRLSVSLTGTRASAANGVISGLSSTTGLSIGMTAIGTGIGTGAVIQSIDSATQVTLSVSNTATGTATIRFGVIDGTTLGAAGGSHVHKLTTEQMPSHTHTLAGRGDRNTVGGGSDSIPIQSAGNANFISNARGSDQSHPNLQPTLVTNYIIKV